MLSISKIYTHLIPPRETAYIVTAKKKKKEKRVALNTVVSNARNQWIHASSHRPIGFHSQEIDCGFIEPIPCGNIFTAFFAIRKEISANKSYSKI